MGPNAFSRVRLVPSSLSLNYLVVHSLKTMALPPAILALSDALWRAVIGLLHSLFGQPRQASTKLRAVIILSTWSFLHAEAWNNRGTKRICFQLIAVARLSVVLFAFMASDPNTSTILLNFCVILETTLESFDSDDISPPPQDDNQDKRQSTTSRSCTCTLGTR